MELGEIKSGVSGTERMQTWTKNSNASSGGDSGAGNVSRCIHNLSGNVKITPRHKKNMMQMTFATSALHWRVCPAEAYVCTVTAALQRNRSATGGKKL